jgi:hypothetical protein
MNHNDSDIPGEIRVKTAYNGQVPTFISFFSLSSVWPEIYVSETVQPSNSFATLPSEGGGVTLFVKVKEM